MGILNFFKRIATRDTNTRNPAKWLIDFVTGGATASGVTVNQVTALRHTPVWAAITLVSEKLGDLPLHVFQRAADGSRRRVENPISKLLSTQPNRDMPAGPFFETLTGHVMLGGNAYAEIERNQGEVPIALWPLDPKQMQIKRESSGELLYICQFNGLEVGIVARNILHLRGYGDNGIVGMSPIRQNRDQLSIGMAATKFAGSFFANDASPSGVLTHPLKLDQVAADRLKANWKKAHSGGNARSVAVLEEGLTWEQIALSPEDSQLAEIQAMSVQDVARIYHIPPHKLQDLSNATFSNIEHQGLEFLTDTLSTWMRRWTQEINLKLLTGGLFSDFIVEALLRGDIKTRYDAFRVAIQSSFLMPNEARRFENLPPVEGGDVILVPQNMTTIDRVGESQAPTVSINAARSFRPLLLEVIERRITTKEIKALRRAIGGDVQAAAESFYPKHREHIRSCLAPVVSALAVSCGAAVDVEGYLIRLADELCDQSRSQAVENASDLETLLSTWEGTRSEVLADRIITDFGGPNGNTKSAEQG